MTDEQDIYADSYYEQRFNRDVEDYKTGKVSFFMRAVCMLTVMLPPRRSPAERYAVFMRALRDHEAQAGDIVPRDIFIGKGE